MSNFSPPVKALFFDVFGTCVDWRSSVTNALWDEKENALKSSSSSISPRVREKAEAMTREDCGDLALEWRNTYLKFTGALAADPNLPYKTVDQHHLDSLRDILTERGLLNVPATGSLWDEDKIIKLSQIWHFLTPWPDTVQGIQDLNKNFATCTLSNGNVALLQDMVQHGKMPFTNVFSAEMFKSYKPNPSVYLGAAKKLDLKPEECMMVAAHLGDLKHAKQCGLRTLYVERPQEEMHPQLRELNIPDVWVSEGEEGFVTAAERLTSRESA